MYSTVRAPARGSRMTTGEPLTPTGQSKYEGELAVEELVKKFFIVRIAWVFGVNGKNFIKTMLRVAKSAGQSVLWMIRSVPRLAHMIWRVCWLI